jgi:pyrroloquinoline quinone (PQQ) biosynthesis protein C
MEFSSEQMAKYVAEYASVLTATAQTLRTLAAALDANNGAEAERANRELERLSVREHSAVSHMDSWCQPD